MSPEIATLCELVLNPEIPHLELETGSKVQSTQRADNVKVCMGKSICRVGLYSYQIVERCGPSVRSQLALIMESCHQLERASDAHLDRKRME